MAPWVADALFAKFFTAFPLWWKNECAAPDLPTVDANLLPRRMAVLGLNTEMVARWQPITFCALQRLCATCDCQETCERDLIYDSAASTWRNYCPNSATLDALAALMDNRSRAPLLLF
jgi:hypothetical protein